MKTKSLSVLLVTSLLLCSQIAADGGEDGAASRGLSLTEVTRFVLENNPAIKEAEHRWRAAIQRAHQAYAWDDPRVAGESRVRRFVDVPPNAFIAETDYSKLQETRRDLERNLSDAQSQLNTVMNRDAFAPLGPPAGATISATELSASRLRAITLAQRPEVQMARAKIDGEKSKLQLAHRAWIPDPTLMVKGQRYNDAAEAVSELDAGVSFTIPWVNPGKYSAGVREGRANLAAAEQGLEREQKEASRLLRDQLSKVETFHHHVELFQDKLVPQAQQAFEATQLSYESGKATFLDWIGAQRNLRDIEAMARDHLAHYQMAVADLEAVIGADVYSARPHISKGGNSR